MGAAHKTGRHGAPTRVRLIKNIGLQRLDPAGQCKEYINVSEVVIEILFAFSVVRVILLPFSTDYPLVNKDHHVIISR